MDAVSIVKSLRFVNGMREMFLGDLKQIASFDKIRNKKSKKLD